MTTKGHVTIEASDLPRSTCNAKNVTLFWLFRSARLTGNSLKAALTVNTGGAS